MGVAATDTPTVGGAIVALVGGACTTLLCCGGTGGGWCCTVIAYSGRAPPYCRIGLEDPVEMDWRIRPVAPLGEVPVPGAMDVAIRVP